MLRQDCKAETPLSAFAAKHATATPLGTSYDIPVGYRMDPDGRQTCLYRCEKCVEKLGVSVVAVEGGGVCMRARMCMVGKGR